MKSITPREKISPVLSPLGRSGASGHRHDDLAELLAALEPVEGGR